MPRALLSILAGLFVASSAAAQVAGPSPAAQRYDGYRLVEVTAEDARQVLALASFDATGGPLVFAGEQVAAGIPLQFAADAAGLEILASLGLEPEVVFEDLGAAIQLERDRSVDALRASSDTFFDAYRTFDEIRARLAEIDASSGLVSIEQIGESFEGRPIELVRVSGAGDALTKPTIFMTFGCHAREWISASSAPFLVDALASRYGQDARVTRLLDLATVAIVPQANPDGYEFTWTDDRFWRKTRRPLEDGVNVGVDWNRNFSERWLTGLISGPSEGLYAGPEPFSEPETRAVRDAGLAIANPLAFIDWHSFTQQIIPPRYGAGSTLADDSEPLTPIEAAVHRSVSNYLIQGARTLPDGAAAEYAHWDLYSFGGGALDWAHAELGVISLLVELPPTGSPGFLIGPESIRPVGEQVLEMTLSKLEILLGDGIEAVLSPRSFAGETVEVTVHSTGPEVAGVSLISGSGVDARTTPMGSFPDALPFESFIENPLGTGPFLAETEFVPCGEALALAVDIELDDGSVVRRPLDPISGVEFGTLQNGGQDSRDGIEASPPWRFGVAPISGEVGWSANGVRSAVFRSRVFDVDAWDPLIQQEIWLAIDSFVLWIQEFSGVRVWLESPDRGRSVEVPISRLVSETELNQIVGERHSIRVPLDDALRELTPSFRVRAAFFGRDPMLFELRDIRIEARGCPVPLGPADLAVPFGVMTANDIQAFLDAFQSGSLAADLAEPYGVVSQLDIAEFVGQFFGF